MKLLFDTNVFISFLLARGTRNRIKEGVEACIADPSIEIVVPQEVIDEIERVVSEKEYLRSRIPEESLAEFLETIPMLGKIRPALADIPSISRDPKDDFLLAQSSREDVEYLVTGDDDLLSMGELGTVKIVTIARMCEILFDRGFEQE